MHVTKENNKGIAFASLERRKSNTLIVMIKWEYKYQRDKRWVYQRWTSSFCISPPQTVLNSLRVSPIKPGDSASIDITLWLKKALSNLDISASKFCFQTCVIAGCIFASGSLSDKETCFARKRESSCIVSSIVREVAVAVVRSGEEWVGCVYKVIDFRIN